MRTKFVEGRSSVLAMTPPDGLDTPTIFKEMTSNSVAISQPDGYLRFAPSWPTSESEIQHVIDVSESYLK